MSAASGPPPPHAATANAQTTIQTREVFKAKLLPAFIINRPLANYPHPPHHFSCLISGPAATSICQLLGKRRCPITLNRESVAGSDVTTRWPKVASVPLKVGWIRSDLEPLSAGTAAFSPAGARGPQDRLMVL